jgi:vacuolar-type H+-ATPase subunit I/STV1
VDATGSHQAVTHDLEALKLRLVEMSSSDLTSEETDAMAQEISAIRLQLKRLREEQRAMSERVQDLKS